MLEGENQLSICVCTHKKKKCNENCLTFVLIYSLPTSKLLNTQSQTIVCYIGVFGYKDYKTSHFEVLIVVNRTAKA